MRYARRGVMYEIIVQPLKILDDARLVVVGSQRPRVHQSKVVL